MGLFGGSRPDLMAGANYENARNTAFQAGAPAESAALFMNRQDEGLSRAQKLKLLGSTFRDIGASLGGRDAGAIDATNAGFEAQAAAAFKSQQERALQALGKGLFGNDARAQLLMRMNPKAFSDALAKGYEPQQVTAGNTLLNGPGSKPFLAPKLVQDGNIFGTQSVAGFTPTGEREATIGETETATHNRASEDAAMTPEGFLPRKDASGKIVGFDLDPGYGNFATERAAAGATRVNVPVTLQAQNAFSDALAKSFAGRLDTAMSNADTAQGSITTLNDALGALNGRGGAITGAGSGVRLGAAKALSLIGDTNAKDRVANTETFEAVMGKQVLAIAKQLGSGSGISNADRDFAGKVAGGAIALDENSIRRLIDIQQREATSQVGRAQAMGREAFNAVPPSQGLPASAFGGGVAAAPRVGAQPGRRKFNPATGRIE